MTAFCMKLGLYQAVLAMHPGEAFRTVSWQGQTQVLTPWIRINDGGPYALVLNGSPNETENCGGRAAPAFPFCTGPDNPPVRGSLFFHLSRETIPANQEFLWIPECWHDPIHMSTIALVIMCLAPFPMCNIGLRIPAEDGLDHIVGIPFQSWLGGLVHIQGETVIHILWPRRSALQVRPGGVQAQANQLIWDQMAMFQPFAGPDTWGETAAGARYHVGGDSPADHPPAVNLVEFCLSWLTALTEKDYRDVTSYFSEAGVLGRSWHVIFEVLAVWATRTGCMVVRGDEPMGTAVAADRQHILENDEVNLQTYAVMSNRIPKLPLDTDWLNHLPDVWDGMVNRTSVSALGAVMGGYGVGSSGRAEHASIYWGVESNTWLPMTLWAFRVIGVAADLTLAYFKMTPEIMNNLYSIENFHESLSAVYEALFVSTQNRDPRYLDMVDFCVAHMTQGGFLHTTDSRTNILRTIYRPREWAPTIYSRDFTVGYANVIPIKYPDVYFQQISDVPLKEWAPFVVSQSGFANQGLKKDTGCKEMNAFRQAGPLMTDHCIPPDYNARTLFIWDGLSQWNSRLLLISGHANLVVYPNGEIQPDFPPLGQLPTLIPWHVDGSMLPAYQLLSCWSYVNTIFFPSTKFDVIHPLLLSIVNPIQQNQIRKIQGGSTSFDTISWMMSDFTPQPLRADAGGRADPRTLGILGMFSRTKTALDGPPSILDQQRILKDDQGRKETKINPGNAQEEAVRERSSEQATSSQSTAPTLSIETSSSTPPS